MIWFLLVVIALLVFLLLNEMKVNRRKSAEMFELRKMYNRASDLIGETSTLCHRRGMMTTLYESGMTPEQVKAIFAEVDRRAEQDAAK